MKNKSNPLLLAVLLGMGLPLTQLHAANAFLAPGDLILYFQKPGDTDTVYVALGSAALNYRGSASGPTADRQALNIININSSLVEAFGEEWASDTGIYAGLAGVRSNSLATTVVNGDQNRTLYISQPRTSVGTLGAVNSEAWDLNTAQSQTSGATQIQGLTNNFENNLTTQQGVLSTTVSVIDDQNPFVAPHIQDIAFLAFAGGVQQRGSATAFGTFGPAGQVEFAMDLNRIVPDDTVHTNEVAGPSLIGSYEGTIVVGTDGNVSFITQGTASAYDTWIAGFPLLATPTDKLPGTDFDNDGYTNLEEFVLNGNPEVSGQGIAPLLNASGADFLFSFTRRDDSVTEAPAMFQYGSDLSGWTDVPVAADGTFDGVNVAVTPGDAVTDGVVVTLPKSKAVGNKLFGRIKIVK